MIICGLLMFGDFEFFVKHPHAMVVETELGNGFCFTLALGLGLCAGLEGAEAEGLEWSSSTVSLRLHQLGSISAVSEPTSSHINMKFTMH